MRRTLEEVIYWGGAQPTASIRAALAAEEIPLYLALIEEKKLMTKGKAILPRSPFLVAR